MKHGLIRIRDSITITEKQEAEVAGLLAADLQAGFDHLKLAWVYKVLLAKGVSPRFVDILSLQNVLCRN